ncbi:MAG TPA: pirin family protein [Methylomirabilota bacterium]|jgi:quercetin 2,3-dioxygenase|nr:pirin family protein [Methylomirabilota bacterium]
MSIMVRPAAERGHGNHGWLDTWHTFSFSDYYDPRFMGFRVLRVINEDTVAPGRGFPTHGHRDMEIISYVLEGALEHRDSLGTGSVIRPGDVQRMSAGTGVRHSEFNGSPSEPVHFLQIWIEPARAGIAPGYEQKTFADADKQGRLRLVASPDGADGSVTIHQDARVFATRLGPDESIEHKLAPGRHAWVQVTRGALGVNGQRLAHGDGAAVSGESVVRLDGERDAEALVFDLP